MSYRCILHGAEGQCDTCAQEALAKIGKQIEAMEARACLRDWEGTITGKYALPLRQILKGESPDLNPVKQVKDAYPLVLYFPDKSSAQEFIEAVREAYPNWSEKGIS